MNAKNGILIVGILFWTTIVGQAPVKLSGRIVDERSVPVRYASISLLNTNSFSIADSSGGFHLDRIRPGDYIISISSVGYANLSRQIHVPGGKESFLDFTMADASSRLDEVIVTAQKKEENIQAIPSSVSAFNFKSIDDYRLWTTRDLTAVVPNLYAANPGDGRNVTSIRGITSTSYDPAITTYVDGVSQFTLDTYIPQLFDVERIEVLRGPQGTLYGRNAMGGVINIITRQPGNTTTGFVEIDAGNFGQQRLVASIRTPIVKNKLFLGAALFGDRMNGFFRNKFDNSKFDRQHGVGGNFYLKYLNGSGLVVTLNLKDLSNRNEGSFPLAPSPAEAFASPFLLNQNAIAKLVDNTLNASLSVSYAGSHLNLTSQTAWQTNYRYYATPIDGDFSPADAVSIINNYGHHWNDVKIATQEFRISSPASINSRLSWIAGSYLFYQDAPNKQATHFGKDAALVGSPDSNYAIVNTTKASSFGIAFFGQATLAVHKNTDVVLGLRYDAQSSKANVLGEYLPDGSPAPIFQTQPDTSAKANFSAFSPMLGIRFHPVAGVNIFANYSRGYRTGGLTQLGADPSAPPLYPYQPEFSDNFELGMKNSLLNNRLRINLSFFYTEISHVQVPTLVLPQAITVTKNAGSLTSKGAELELASTLFRGFELNYEFGATDAKFKKLDLSQNGSANNYGGNRQVFTPAFTSMLAPQYALQLDKANSFYLILRGEWAYLGKQYFDLANTISQAGYQLFNARVGLSTKHFEIYLWGRNLGNKKYISYAYDFGGTHLGDPRSYGVTLKALL